MATTMFIQTSYAGLFVPTLFSATLKTCVLLPRCALCDLCVLCGNSIIQPMNDLREILLKPCRREDLTRDESRHAFLHIMSGQSSDAQIGGLLVGLAAKGTTAEELVGAATVMREKVVRVECDDD